MELLLSESVFRVSHCAVLLTWHSVKTSEMGVSRDHIGWWTRLWRTVVIINWCRKAWPTMGSTIPWAGGPGLYKNACQAWTSEWATKHHSSMVSTSSSCLGTCPDFLQRWAVPYKLKQTLFSQLFWVMVLFTATEWNQAHPPKAKCFCCVKDQGTSPKLMS